VEAGDLLAALDREGICAASGSACTTGSVKPSHVLTAMGLNDERARSSIRFSLGCYNTMEEVEFVLERLPAMVRELRSNRQVSGTASPRKAVAASRA
jgi:cysteine desulfurase